ncbi:MAG: alkaline phosphatase family protein [Thermoflexales bacterium]
MPGDNGPIIIQLDGLSHPRLRDGIARGLLPTLDRWLREGTHHLHPLDSGLPSQTSSAQAALLYGVSDPPPGFRWYDRGARRARTSRSPADLRHVARAWPDRTGLLLGGAAITTAWPAGADRRTLVLSEGPRRANLRSIPWNAKLGPRWPQGARYARLAAILRGALVAGALDALTTSAAVAAIGAVRGPVFATLLGYDQVAHHAGLDAPMTDWALCRHDNALRVIERANNAQNRRAELVVFADHGLSGCVSFQKLRRETLGGMIARATGTSRRDWHVAPSGNLAHVYALSAQAMSALSSLVPVLMRDDAIGFVVHDGIAHGRNGKVDLASGTASGDHPLVAFGSPGLRTRQIAGLARHPDAGDLIVMGAADGKGAVTAFEDQRAAHGGLGGPQTQAFAMLPVGVSATDELNLSGLRERLLGMLGHFP